jgi:hypothetical protein
MAELNGLVDLKRVSDGLVYKMGLDKYFVTKFYQFAIDGVVDMNLYTLGETKVVKLELNTTLNTINFPSDFMRFIDVAIPKAGELWSLTKKDTMINTTTLVDGDETYDSDDNEGLWEYYHQINAGGKNDNYYKIDYKNRRILVSGDALTKVWLVYISSGVSTNDATYIPREAKPYIEAYIRYNYHLNDPKGNANKIAYNEIVLRREKNKLKRTKFPTMEQMFDAISNTFYRVTK